jgi:hypothetical protein
MFLTVATSIHSGGAKKKIKIAGAIPNDGSNQNETHTNSHIHILQMHKFYVKFKNTVSSLKNKDTN